MPLICQVVSLVPGKQNYVAGSPSSFSAVALGDVCECNQLSSSSSTPEDLPCFHLHDQKFTMAVRHRRNCHPIRDIPHLSMPQQHLRLCISIAPSLAPSRRAPQSEIDEAVLQRRVSLSRAMHRLLSAISRVTGFTLFLFLKTTDSRFSKIECFVPLSPFFSNRKTWLRGI